MKKSKLSLVAALALTTGLQAADVKFDQRLGVTTAVDKGYTKDLVKDEGLRFDGQLRFWYQTMDHGGIANGQRDKGLFAMDKNQPNEWGNVEAQFSISGKVNDHLKAKVTAMTVSTMGMDAHLTPGQTARMGQFGSSNAADAQPFWVHEAYLDYAFTKNTNVKVGRMELDTPLVFTEKWNATANAFEAIVAANTDIPDTTLVGAWVSKGNGATNNLVAAPQVFGAESKFSNFMEFNHNGKKLSDGGALAFGAINKSISSLPLQAWIYAAPDAAQAFWLQADASIKDVGPLSGASLQVIGAGVGTQGATQNYLESGAFGNNDKTQMTNSVAAKAAASAGIFNAYAAFSQNSKGNLPVANIGTNFKKTKLPTASIFNDGMVVAQPDTTAWKIGGGAKIDGIGVFGISYGSSVVGKNAGYQNPNGNVGGPASMGFIAQNFTQSDITSNEIDVTYNTKIKDVDLAVMYINLSSTYVPVLGNKNAAGDNNWFYDYGTFDNQVVRVVATLKF